MTDIGKVGICRGSYGVVVADLGNDILQFSSTEMSEGKEEIDIVSRFEMFFVDMEMAELIYEEEDLDENK